MKVNLRPTKICVLADEGRKSGRTDGNMAKDGLGRSRGSISKLRRTAGREMHTTKPHKRTNEGASSAGKSMSLLRVLPENTTRGGCARKGGDKC